MQYFVKLLLLSQEPAILLFGFCAPTEQPVFAWKKIKPDKSLPLLQYTAILKQTAKDKLLATLDSGMSFALNDDSIVFNLKPRPSVFSDTAGSEYERNKPVSKLHIVDEYWHLDKAWLIEKLEQSFSPSVGRELRSHIRRFFEVLQRECGIDFAQEGERLGNFEYYRPGKYLNSLEVKKTDFTSIKLCKKHAIAQDLIVNCAAKNEGRWVCEKIKEFPASADELTFAANEPLTYYKIKVWEKESGELVYSSACASVMEILIDLSLTNDKIIHDPWTQKLQQNASKHRDDIKKIERVTVNSRYETIHINSEEQVPWRKAKQDGQRVCAVYKKTKTKGAFIPKTADRKGEMDSFQKVREYIEEKGIKKVVLADPFFSVQAAAKLLGRISSSSLELDIVTALTTINPDTSEKNKDIKEQCQTFIKQNRNIFHPNLTILNVLRGTSQAFHDRYLIRYFKDGHIDGFLLSNSLNSAGQFFPFVIAPLEDEVCLAAAEYLQKLTDVTYQSQLSPREQVQIELLCSPERERKNVAIENECYTLPRLLTAESNLEKAVQRCVELNYFKDDSSEKSFTVLVEALPVIIPILFRCWESSPEAALTALGEALYHSYFQAIYTAKDILGNIPGAISRYLEILAPLAADMEGHQKHGQKSIDSGQFQYWAILNGNAKVGSIPHLVNNSQSIYYEEDGHWSSLYRLLWLLNPEIFLETLETVKSPLMLSILIEHIAIGEYDQGIHGLLLASQWEWVQDLAAEWLWRGYDTGKLDLSKMLDALETEWQLEQSAYLLSNAAFHARMLGENTSEADKAKAWALCDELIGRVVKLCNEMNSSNDYKINVLKKVSDCEKTCNAWLLLSLAEKIEDEAIRNNQLERIINIFFDADNSLPYNMEGDSHYLKLVAKAAELRYMDSFEGTVGAKLLRWRSLNDWLEPYLYDRDYKRWSNADKIVRWDLEFLRAYQKIGNKLSGKLKIYFERASNNKNPVT